MYNKGKNDSSNISGLFGEPIEAPIRKPASGIRTGSYIGQRDRQPAPFMTDPSLDPNANNQYQEYDTNEEAIIRSNVSAIENRIEDKLREIDAMMVVQPPKAE